MTQAPRSKLQNFILIVTLGILNTLTPFSIDMYLPSFPEIAKELGATVAQVTLSVSIYFIGFSIGQIIYGPLLDRFGRKPPIYAGLLIYILASIGCASSHSLEALLIFRVLSALGGCAASVGAMAMVRDFFPPESSTKLFSMLMLVLSASPLLAPSIGSFVLAVASWRAIFAILAAVAVIDILLLKFALPPAAPADHGVQLRLKPILATFWSILKIPQFTIYTLTGSLSFAGLFVYVAGSPAIFMDTFQVSAKTYGAIFAALAVGMIGGGQLNLIFVKHFKEQTIFRTALIVQVIASIGFVTMALLNACGLEATLAFLFVILSCAGVTNPNGAALALQPLTKNIGSASSLLGFLQLGIGSVTSAMIGVLEAKGSLPTAATMCVSSVLALTVLILSPLWLKKKNSEVFNNGSTLPL